MSDRHQLAALKRGAARKEKVAEAVDAAMRSISQDMKANGGVYPHNGGAVNILELARQAGINESTFYKPANVELKKRASLWLETLQKKETVGRKRVKKTYQQRAQALQERLDTLSSEYLVVNLQLQQCEAEKVKLRADYEALLEQVRTGGNVTAIRKENR